MRLIDADHLLERMRKDPLFRIVDQYGVSGVIETEPTVNLETDYCKPRNLILVAAEDFRPAAKDKNVLTKRTQAERIAIVESLLVGLREEIEAGQAENILQAAVYAQIDINRIVFEVNAQMNERKRKACALCDDDDVYTPCGIRIGTEEQARALLDDDPSHPYADDVMMGD